MTNLEQAQKFLEAEWPKVPPMTFMGEPIGSFTYLELRRIIAQAARQSKAILEAADKGRELMLEISQAAIF